MSRDESWLSFDEAASVLHNKVRAFAGWSGTRAKVVVWDQKSGQQSVIELKIITTRIYNTNNIQTHETDEVTYTKGSLLILCGGGTTLEVTEVQPPGKKVMSAAAFWNGLRGQKLKKYSQAGAVLA